MTAKEYLSQLGELTTKINHKMQELVSLKDPKRSVTMTYIELLRQKKARIKKH